MSEFPGCLLIVTAEWTPPQSSGIGGTTPFICRTRSNAQASRRGRR